MLGVGRGPIYREKSLGNADVFPVLASLHPTKRSEHRKYACVRRLAPRTPLKEFRPQWNLSFGTPLFRGKGHFFRVPKPRFKLHSGNTLVLKTWLTTKRDKLERQRFIVMTAFTAWKISIKPINTQYGRETLIVIFYTLFSCLKWWPDSEAELEIQWNL